MGGSIGGSLQALVIFYLLTRLMVTQGCSCDNSSSLQCMYLAVFMLYFKKLKFPKKNNGEIVEYHQLFKCTTVLRVFKVLISFLFFFSVSLGNLAENRIR